MSDYVIRDPSEHIERTPPFTGWWKDALAGVGLIVFAIAAYVGLDFLAAAIQHAQGY